MTTCNLKCKSEAADKKDSCVSLCFNQCTASIALEKQSAQMNYRPLVLSQVERPEEKMAHGGHSELGHVRQANQAMRAQYKENSPDLLKMDDYMLMKMRK